MWKIIAFVVVLAAPLLLLRGTAVAWWDTWVRAQTSEPCILSLQAKDCQGAKDLVEDAQANAAAGGKVVYVKPGGVLTFTADLTHSVYDVWLIARAKEEEYRFEADRQEEIELPGGAKATIVSPRPIVYSTLTVKYPGGRTQSWSMPIGYEARYGIVSKLYFPVHANGACEISVGLDARSRIGLLVNRIEVRDVLGHCLRKPMKEKRVLTSDEALKQKRQAFAADPKNKDRQWSWKWKGGKRSYRIPAQRSAEERCRTADALWDDLPDWNTVLVDPQFTRFHGVIGRDAPGEVADRVGIYEESGSYEAGWDAAALLCAVAEKYPGLDHYYISILDAKDKSSNLTGFVKKDCLTWSQSNGKSVYSGWAGGDLERLAVSYDKVFDFVRGNREFADYVHARIPWVKTPQDVIEFLDTSILQHGVDCVNREIIRSNEARATCLRVLEVRLGGGMPEAKVFQEARRLLSDPSDENLSCNSRGDVDYIGSTLYVGNGKPENYLCLAGGFPAIIGDAMDQGVGRGKWADGPSHASRVYEGFGAVLLEDGRKESSPLLKRGLAIHTGIGAGHAHQDTLNLELFAHGCRLLPDLGGRHEGSRRSSPNMRCNRMHNVVWIDHREFMNLSPGSTTSATGWTQSFSPQPGSQYTANRARATSHPDVDLYQRSTAMVDGAVTGDRADVYLFDVFRVHGGREHTYCFHGADSEKVEANVTLTPVDEKNASEEAKRVLERRLSKNPLEGPSADPLRMTWMLKGGSQQRYQEKFHQPGKPVGVTLTLFGHGGDRAYVGGAESEAYPVELPYLHVHSRQEAAGKADVYPALIEAHAGGHFIEEAQALPVTPNDAGAERGVAVRVKLAGGRADTLFSSLQPATEHTVDGGVRVAGEFGLISEDADGLRMLHLVGGTKLQKNGVGVEVVAPAYRTSIAKVDYDRRELALADEFPTHVLDGAMALIGSARHREAWSLESVAGRSAKVAKRILYYQSAVESVDPKNRLVVAEREPDVFRADPLYTEGTRLANEKGDKVWTVRYAPRERWMYLGWPNTDLSYPRSVKMEDVPDANGDGRRVLKLMGNGSAEEPADKVILELDVTRVEPESFLFYFKMPENPDYQVGGWMYANRKLVNEDGSKRWLATYPGVVNGWELDGKEPVSLEDFPDADGDGKRKARAYVFGADDTLEIKTHAYLTRVEAGVYELRANTACRVTLCGSRMEISADGKTFRALEGSAADGRVTVALRAEDLGDGAVRIRVR